MPSRISGANRSIQAKQKNKKIENKRIKNELVFSTYHNIESRLQTPNNGQIFNT